MKSFFLYIPLLSIISILGVVGLIITKSMDKDQNNKILNSALIGKHFPRTNLKSLEDNKEFNLNLENKKPFLVNFFSSWCVPCQFEVQNLELLSRQIKVYGIAYKDKKQDTIDFLNTFGNPYYVIGVDDDGLSAIDWGVYGVPETFLINQNGQIVLRHAGPITKSIIKKTFYPEILKLSL